MKRLILFCIMLNSFSLVGMLRRPYHVRANATMSARKPGIVLLSKAQVKDFKKLQGRGLKDDHMQRLMLAAVQLGILENSHLYNADCKKFTVYSANVLANARLKLVSRIENADGYVDLALIKKQFDYEFTRALPKQIECGALPDFRTAIATAATLYGVLKNFDTAVAAAIADHDQDVCKSLTEYVWQKRFRPNWDELERLQNLFGEKI